LTLFSMLEILDKEEEFDSFFKNNRDKSFLVKFSTTWCLPCQELQKNLEKLLLERKDLPILEVDAEKFPKLAQKPMFSIRSVPSLFLFRQGEMVKKVSGNINVEQLKMFVDS